MSIDLTRQRAECISDYPESPFRIGDILEHDGEADECWTNLRTLKKYINLEVAAYPAIFRLLAWWEKRKVEEMPEYVIWDYKEEVDSIEMKGHVAKVTAWAQNGSIVNDTATNLWLPSTKDEYDQYIKQKQ
jgi:hypothetical protein